MVVLYKILISTLLGNYHLLVLHTLMKQAAMLGRSTGPRTEDDLWCKLELRPSVQQPKRNQTNKYLSELGSESFPS